MHRNLFTCLLTIVLVACAGKQVSHTNHSLPYLGEPELVERNVNGNMVSDTVYPKVPEFAFTDQDSMLIDNSTLRGKIYVADFIFLSCPTICPVMTKEMQKVYRHYSENPEIVLLSHTIDPERDTIPRLKAYSENLGADPRKWHFVTGKQEDMLHIADHGYFAIAKKDATAPGGYAHSGGLLLVDRSGHLRGVYDGTDPKETKRLIREIGMLLKEDS